jgi:hypothetical protein
MRNTRMISKGELGWVRERKAMPISGNILELVWRDYGKS